MSLLSWEITVLPSSEGDALGGEMPHANAMQYNTELSMHFQPVGQSKALLLSSWQTSSVVSAPGGELQTACEADSMASPFHT